MQPDRYFTVEERDRLALLMERWRTARNDGVKLSDAEQAELDALVASELEATRSRAADLLAGPESLPPNPDWPADGADQIDHYLYGTPKK